MYSRVIAVSCLVAISLPVLAGCTVVDRFGSRIYDHNLTSQDVMNKEVLINIVRASRYQPLNFMVITQVTGGQSETLSTGLPTISLGPAQTLAQHQFPITNSVSSGATGGYQTNPLVSSQFQQGMMSPVSPKILAYLLASHDRETVLHLVLDSINVTMKAAAKTTTLRYVNDPANDVPAQDGDRDDQDLPRECTVNIASAALQPHRNGSERRFLMKEGVCNYSKFGVFLRDGMKYGLSAELVPIPQQEAATGRRGETLRGGGNGANMPDINANATVTPQATGRLCWDPGLAVAEFKTTTLNLKPQCVKNFNSDGKNESFNSNFTFGTLGTLQFDLRFRSPAAIFRALGQQLHDGSAGRVTPVLGPSMRTFNGQPLLTIKNEDTGDCLVLARYEDHTYCVPHDADRTAMVINILQELKNLSTTPNDLNSAFSVRVVN